MLIGETGERVLGRAQAFHRVEKGLKEAAAGFGSTIVVSGTRRSGRTHFLDEVVRTHAGPAVLLGRLGDPSGSPSAIFWPLFTRLGIDIRSTSIAGQQDQDSDEDVAPFIGNVVLDALERYEPGAHALLIAVDDIDHLSERCIAALGYVARRLTRLRVLLLLVSTPILHPRIDTLRQLPMYTLTLAETRAFVESVTGRQASLPALTSLQRMSRGNPADLAELVEHLSIDQLQGHAAVPAFPPVALQRADRWRAAAGGLSPIQWDVLSILSIVRAVDPELLVTGLRADAAAGVDVAEEITSLVVDGCIERSGHVIRLTSSLDGAAIYSINSPADRRRSHQLIEMHGLLGDRPIHAVVNEVLADGAVGDSLDVLLKATRQLADLGDVGLSIDVLRWSIATATDKSSISALAVHGLRIAAAHGYFADADHFSGDVDFDAVSPADVFATMHTQLQLRYLRDEPFDVEGIERVAGLVAERCPDTAAALAGTAAYFLACRHETATARRLLTATDRIADRRGDNLLAVLARSEIALADDAVELSSRALHEIAPCPREDFTTASATAHLLQQLGRHQDAANRLESLAGHAATPVERVVLLAMRVDHELFTGRIELAHNLWEEADAIVPAEHCLTSMRLCQRVHLLGLRGRFDDATQLAQKIRSHATAAAHKVAEGRLLWALGQIALMRGDGACAVMHLEQSLDIVDSLTGYWQSQRHVDLIEAFTMTGETGAAQSAFRVFESRQPLRSTSSLLKTLARARLLVEESADRAQVALSQALGPGTCPAPAIERARAHAIYAHRVSDDPDSMVRRQHRRRAHALFAQIGAHGWIDGGRWPTSSIPAARGSVPHFDELTAVEQQLVELVQRGERNDAITHRMSLSESSFQRHLAALIRKLDDGSCADLHTELDTRLTEACCPATSDAAAAKPYGEAIRVITEEFVDPELNTALLSRRLGISVRTLHRTFEQHGTSVLREIRHRRIEQAEELLRDRNRPHLRLHEIAAMAGAPSVAYLRLGFKDKHGMSPSEFRRIHTTQATGPR